MSVCVKVAYPSESSARKALRTVQQKGGKHRERRVYQCDVCRLYHLTKEPSDERHNALSIRRYGQTRAFDPDTLDEVEPDSGAAILQADARRLLTR